MGEFLCKDVLEDAAGIARCIVLHLATVRDMYEAHGEFLCKAVLDLGCGSGCLLLARLAELPSCSGVGLDICPKALKVAKSNAERFDLGDHCEWMQSDFNSLPTAFERINTPFDVILFNPPYLERSAWLSAKELAEPDLALFVESKYDAYSAVETGLRQCRSCGHPLLCSGGFLVIGLGGGHLATVRDMYEIMLVVQCSTADCASIVSFVRALASAG